MQKQAFSTAGAQQLFDLLYALNDVQLQVEVAAIRADFRTWVIAHFFLEENQISYLNNMDERWVSNAGNQTADFMQERLPVQLLKAAPLAEEGDGGDRGKLIDLDNASSQSFSSSEGFSEGRRLVYTISYPASS